MTDFAAAFKKEDDDKEYDDERGENVMRIDFPFVPSVVSMCVVCVSQSEIFFDGSSFFFPFLLFLLSD